MAYFATSCKLSAETAEIRTQRRFGDNGVPRCTLYIMPSPSHLGLVSATCYCQDSIFGEIYISVVVSIPISHLEGTGFDSQPIYRLT